MIGVSAKPKSLIHGIDDKPPFLTCLLSAIQHMAILSGRFAYPVIIAEALNFDAVRTASMVSICMIASGVGTMLQALKKGPMGSGYLDPSGNGVAYLPVSVAAAKTGSLSLVLGMTLLAGFSEGLFSQVLKKLRALFPPEVTGTVVTMVGISVIKIALGKFMGIDELDTNTDHFEILTDVVTLAIIIGCTVWGLRWMRLYAVLIAMAAGYLVAYMTGIIGQYEYDQIAGAAWVSLPKITFSGWSFRIELLAPFLMVALSTALKSAGELLICQKINDADWKKADIEPISRGILADAAATVFSAVIGGMGQGSSAGNIGLSMASGVTSRRVAYFIGFAFIALAFLPKLVTFFVIMPKPVMGSILLIISCYMITSGLQTIVSRMMDTRKIYVVGLSLIAGLSVDMAPWYFYELPKWTKPVIQSPLASATLCAIVLNILFRIGVSARSTLTLSLQQDRADKIFDFMEEQGGHWGARKDVIQKASSVMAEFFEMAQALDLTPRPIVATAGFDEFNLDICFQYEGELVDFQVSKPQHEDLLSDDTAVAKLAAYLIRSNTDKIRTEQKDGLSKVFFHFEH